MEETFSPLSIVTARQKLWSYSRVQHSLALRTVPTEHKGFRPRLGPCEKRKSLQELLEPTKKNRGGHEFFRDK